MSWERSDSILDSVCADQSCLLRKWAEGWCHQSSHNECDLQSPDWSNLWYFSRFTSWPLPSPSQCSSHTGLLIPGRIPLQCRRHRRCRFDPWVWKIPQRRTWQLTPVLLLGKSHGQRGLAGYSPKVCRESDTTEQPRIHTHALWHA